MLTHITIRNFKSIRELAIAMKPINVLIGENGAGKSNFIQAIELAGIAVGRTQSVEEIFGLPPVPLKDRPADYDGKKNLADYVAIKGGADRLLYRGRKASDAIYYHFRTERDAIPYDFEADNDSYKDWSFKLIPTESDTVFYKWSPRELPAYEISYDEEGNMEPLYFDPLRTILIRHQYIHLNDTSPTSPLRKMARTEDNLRLSVNNLPAYLSYLQKTKPLIFEQITTIVQSVAPYFERFDLSDYQNRQYIPLKWVEKGSPHIYRDQTDLSDGALRFIFLTTLLLQPIPPRLLLIDEPELGLHPVALEQLAGLVRVAACKTQIILSTQSAALVDCFTPEDIITVDRNNEDQSSTFRRHSAEELKDWLENYSLGELWNKNVLGGRP